MGQTKEHKIVVPVPRELGLTEADLEALRNKFQTSAVEGLGGSKALAARDAVIVVVIIVY